MTSIYRYKLEVVTEQFVSLPASHEVLSVAPGRDGYYIDMWAKVAPSDTQRVRTVHIFGTGHPMPDGPPLDFVGTAVMSDGLVWHVFTEAAYTYTPETPL